MKIRLPLRGFNHFSKTLNVCFNLILFLFPSVIVVNELINCDVTHYCVPEDNLINTYEIQTLTLSNLNHASTTNAGVSTYADYIQSAPELSRTINTSSTISFPEFILSNTPDLRNLSVHYHANKYGLVHSCFGKTLELSSPQYEDQQYN